MSTMPTDVLRVTCDDGSWELYTYDRSGSLKEAINEHSHVQFTRNKMGYIESEQQDDYIVQRVYNSLGECIKINSNLGAEIQFHHDHMGRLAGMQASQHGQLWESQLRYNQAATGNRTVITGWYYQRMEIRWRRQAGEHRVAKGNVMQSWKKYTWDAGGQA